MTLKKLQWPKRLILGYGLWLFGKPDPGLSQFKQKRLVAWIVCDIRQAQTFGRSLPILLGCWHVTHPVILRKDTTGAGNVRFLTGTNRKTQSRYA